MPCIYRENYLFGITIGSGTFGLVREAIGPVGKVAIKIIRKDNPDVKREHILNEVDMLQTLKHPHIIKFIEWFESNVRFASSIMQSVAHIFTGKILHRYRAS